MRTTLKHITRLLLGMTITAAAACGGDGASIAFASEKSKPRLSTGTVSGNAITANAQVGDIPFEIDLVK